MGLNPIMVSPSNLINIEIYQRRRCVQTKVGVTDLFKPQNPGEVVVLAKSAIFA